MKNHSNPTERLCELIACLLRKPRTVAEMVEYTGMSTNATRRWLLALQQSGVVYVCGHASSKFKYAKIYAMQPTPFALQDAERPSVHDILEGALNV